MDNFKAQELIRESLIQFLNIFIFIGKLIQLSLFNTQVSMIVILYQYSLAIHITHLWLVVLLNHYQFFVISYLKIITSVIRQFHRRNKNFIFIISQVILFLNETLRPQFFKLLQEGVIINRCWLDLFFLYFRRSFRNLQNFFNKAKTKVDVNWLRWIQNFYILTRNIILVHNGFIF